MEVELCYYETTFKGNLKKRVHMKLNKLNSWRLNFVIIRQHLRETSKNVYTQKKEFPKNMNFDAEYYHLF